MRAILLLLTLAVGVFAAESRAYACSCVPPDISRSYRTADHVVHVRVLGLSHRTREYAFYSAALVEDAYKGCLKARSRVLIRTAQSSAACGVTLQRGQEYLVHGATVRSVGAVPTLQTGLCDANGVWSELSKDQLAFLGSRFNCCGASCACTDGSSPVNCLVDPCEVDSCDVAGAVCEANYCGGCNAEWYDDSGARVCTSQCDYDDPTRRYLERDPETCSAIRFRCPQGEQPFFDDCGCGCESVECEQDECGPPLGMPNTLCSDGVTWAGPSGRCLRQASGGCGWEIVTCPICLAPEAASDACGKACASSAQCAPDESCTTEDGVCNRPPGCGPDVICPAVCYGLCRPKIAA